MPVCFGMLCLLPHIPRDADITPRTLPFCTVPYRTPGRPTPSSTCGPGLVVGSA